MNIEHESRGNVLFGAIGGALAPNALLFVAARAIGGLGIGMSTVVAPLYISEIAPAVRRGRLTGLFQFNIVFGIVVAYLSNALLRDVGADAWRWMIGVAAIPSALYIAMCLALPESPRWLLTRGNDRAAALAGLRRLDPHASDAGLQAMAEIFPTRYRAEGQAVGSLTHWLMAALLTTVFPALVTSFAPYQVFAFFAFMMFLQLLWVQMAVIETKGMSLEDVARRVSGRPREI